MSNPLPDPEATLQRAKETIDEQLSRLELMGDPFGDWDLSEHDRAAIQGVLALLAVRTQERDDALIASRAAELIPAAIKWAAKCKAAESALLTCQRERDEARHLCNAEYLFGVAVGQSLTQPVTGFPGVSSTDV